jgi:hypothetical protein
MMMEEGNDKTGCVQSNARVVWLCRIPPSTLPAMAETRPFDIPLGDSEVITIDLNNLDEDPTDLLTALEEAHCPVWVWTKLAAEHWRAARAGRDEDRIRALDTAERIGNKAKECECCVWGKREAQELKELSVPGRPGQPSPRVCAPV